MNYNLAISIATDSIKKEEGYAHKLPDGRVQAYLDKNANPNKWTIGWGNTYYEDGSPVKEGDIIPYSRAVSLLKYIVAQKEKAIRPAVTAKLNENQYAAILDLTYNWGEGNVRQSKLLKLINAGADQQAILDQWDETAITAGGKYLGGLYQRRLNEFKLFTADVAQVIHDNPQVSLATGLTILAVTGYYIYRFAKRK